MTRDSSNPSQGLSEDAMHGAFQSEAQMTTPAIDAALSWWGSRAPLDFVATEVVGHDAIADLAAVRFDQGALAKRTAASIRPVVDRLALLTILCSRRRGLTVGELAETLRVTRSGIRRAVHVAADAGALLKTEDTWRAHPDWRPATKRIVAVELKLRDYRRALQQADAYLRWADAAWVVLARAPSPAAAAQARARGIGIAVLAPDGTVKTESRARGVRGTRDWSSIWAGEQVAARALAAGQCLGSRPVRARRSRPAGALAPAAR